MFFSGFTLTRLTVTMPPKKFVGTIRRFAKPPTDVTYFNIHSMHSPQSQGWP